MSAPVCPDHNVAMKVGKPEFGGGWYCPEKVNGKFCKHKIKDSTPVQEAPRKAPPAPWDQPTPASDSVSKVMTKLAPAGSMEVSGQFKTTPAGTKLPLFMIERRKKNKQTGVFETLPPVPYLQVAYRLVWFREEHPDWGLVNTAIENTNTHATMRCEVFNEQGRLIAVAHKSESFDTFPDGFLEKAETGAVGRALAMCGYGTQFEPEFDEQERVVDAPIEPVSQVDVDVQDPMLGFGKDPDEGVPF